MSINKIVSIKEYWKIITSNDLKSPLDGMFLLAEAGFGQGVDIDYRLRFFNKDEAFIEGNMWGKPFAYYQIDQNIAEKWVRTDLQINNNCPSIQAPQAGIPVLAITKDSCPNGSTVEYLIGNSTGEYSESGVRTGDDIAVGLRWWDSAGPCGYAPEWYGYRILGFQMIPEIPYYAVSIISPIYRTIVDQ